MSRKQNTWLYDNIGMWKARWLLPIFVLTTIIVIMATAVIVRTVAHYYTKSNCGKYEKTWNRPTKFVDYNYWSWHCLTKVGDQWLPTSKVRITVSGNS